MEQNTHFQADAPSEQKITAVAAESSQASTPSAKTRPRRRERAIPIDLVLELQADPAASIQAEKEHFARELLERLDHAAAIVSTDDTLTDPELQFLRQVEKRMTRTKKGLIERNFDLLALHRGGHWRQHYSSFEEFARRHADLSESQLRKILDETAQAEVFLRAGLYQIRPQGKHAQLLLKVTDRARCIEAWQYARSLFTEQGTSRDSVRDSLRDFCQANHIPFGRRKESEKERQRRESSPSAKVTPVLDLTPSLPVAQALQQIIRPQTLALVASNYTTKTPAEVIADAIQAGLRGEQTDSVKATQVTAVLLDLKETNEEAYKRLIAIGLSAIGSRIDDYVQHRCKNNIAEKARHRRKRQATKALHAPKVASRDFSATSINK